MPCSGCPRRFVGHGGNLQSPLVCIGTAPGVKDRPGEPFSGYAARDFDHVILPRAGISRNSILMGNVVSCHWEDQKDIPAETISQCSRKHIPPLLGNAEVIALMGQKACSALGVNARDDHGFARWMKIPSWKWEGIVVPTLHPAETMHDPSVIGSLVADFQSVRAALRGDIQGPPPSLGYQSHIIADSYEVRLRSGEPVAIDTEWDTESGKPISLQYSTNGQTGHLIRASDYASRISFDTQVQQARPILLHNQNEDLKMLSQMEVFLPEDHILDTMAMCFHHGLPQGLKEVSWRELGGDWLTYDELVMPYYLEKLNDYVEAAMTTISFIKIPQKRTIKTSIKGSPLEVEVPFLMPVYPGKMKPHPLLKKLEKLYQTDHSTWAAKLNAWKDREELERLCGPIPKPSLLLVPERQMVEYACADAVYTFRLYELLRKRRVSMKF